MARKKAQVEGAASEKPAEEPAVVEETPAEEVVEAASLGVEETPNAKLPDPVPGDDGDAFQRIADAFKARFPEDWENIRLCPLQSGIPAMADLLRHRG